MTNALEQLRQLSVLVADTGSLDAVKTYKPVDCTTNPSLVLAAFNDPACETLLAKEVEAGRKADRSPEQVTDTLTVAIGAEMSGLVHGRISTEVDARLSFDPEKSIDLARRIIADYEARGVGRERVLIKLAGTWEGIRAAEALQGDGIDCNITLIFSLEQAVAAADAGAYLVSPFVGRITDWHKKAESRDEYAPDEDPGVKSVRRIYNYFKANGIYTIVMGASFRNTCQVRALAGCDRLTISPKLLEQLSHEDGPVPRKMSPDGKIDVDPMKIDEPAFRWALNANEMASEKLAEGIRQFDADHQKLLELVASKMR
jgi:transaldolase